VDYLVLNLALLITNSTFPRNHHIAVSTTFPFPEGSDVHYRELFSGRRFVRKKNLIVVLPVRRTRCVNNTLSRVRLRFFNIANFTVVIRFSLLVSFTLILTFICLRRSYISYELASRTVRSWRQNSIRCFSQYWPWNALRNRICGGACCGGSGGREIIINAIRWGAWYYSIVLNACRVTIMADTGIDAFKKQRNAEYAKQYRMKRKLLTYKWFGTFIIKDGRYTFIFFIRLICNYRFSIESTNSYVFLKCLFENTL
jgi:hypothetical protein